MQAALRRGRRRPAVGIGESRTHQSCASVLVDSRRLFDSLLAEYGPRHWWPGEAGFEILAGALLVQRTSWRNAEQALAALRDRGLTTAAALARAEPEVVEACVRSAGFYRSKARRLQQLADWVVVAGGLEELAKRDTPELRSALMERPGIGPETADTILLYAFERPVVVIDEYLRRLLGRLSGAEPPPDAAIRERFMRAFDDPASLNEFHALVVEHGKRRCRTKPICYECVLAERCGTGRLRAGIGISDA